MNHLLMFLHLKYLSPYRDIPPLSFPYTTSTRLHKPLRCHPSTQPSSQAAYGSPHPSTATHAPATGYGLKIPPRSAGRTLSTKSQNTGVRSTSDSPSWPRCSSLESGGAYTGTTTSHQISTPPPLANRIVNERYVSIRIRDLRIQYSGSVLLCYAAGISSSRRRES